ncbi:MAG: hypothetical protein KDD45_18180 [Bdellovibrionales bacterium]|nr:hypothetical protein [Bdellovibrionales bacterium]
MKQMPIDTGPLNISISGIIAGLLFGIIGLWMFREGKRRSEIPILLIGIALMVYPYFTSGPLADWGVGIILCGLAYRLWN